MSSVNITEVEGIMRIGVNQETELNSLLTYYRAKVEDCNKERQEWIAKYDECKFDADFKHKLQWENKHLKDRIEELERTLSHHKTALYDERQNYLKLIRENTQLKKRQGEDTRKIQELISVCDPLESGMVMCKDVRPEILNTFISNDLNIHKNGSFSGNTTSLADKVKSANSTAVGAQKQRKPQKTISHVVPAPGEIQTSHELELINLRKLHDMEARNFEEQVSVLKQEIERLREKHAQKHDKRSDDYNQLLDRHGDLERKHNSLAQEYFAIRMKLTDNEQRVQENNQLLRVKNLFLAEKMKDNDKKYERESRAIEQLVAKRNNDFKAKYKQDMRKKEEHLNILKQQYQKIQEIYLNKVKTLEDHLSKLNDKHNQLTKKSRREITYLNAQLKITEKRVEAEQVQKMRMEIQQLESEERRKAEQEEKQEQRLQKEAFANKKGRQVEIQKAYGRNPEKHNPAKVEKNRMKQVQQESEDESSAEVDSQDIENIHRHIQELQDKLGLSNS